ncbi:hypothetical protein H6G06_17135 [Anabaena sphaerica FACHB-251]|uniref:Uncharacterized protein n=1 Tax=Anabaena sphaerica FACHB-251 TaxID=2692883 RepID=A0A926WJC2_9NOST|nr:ribosome-inactivating family protein [Anabaena sphaerica]MBD2295157.1 hypothetical protein [Anabaena sphaerica FACHB-251]
MKLISKQLFQQKLALRLGAIIAISSTVIASPLTTLASPVSAREERTQPETSLDPSLFYLIAQNNPDPSQNKIIRVNLLDSAEQFTEAINLIRLNQTEEVAHPSLDGVTIRRPFNRPDTDYFIVAVPFEGSNIGFVVRRDNLYLQGYIRNFNPEQVSGTYYYLRGATVTSVSEASAINPRPLDRDENYNSLFDGDLTRGTFSISDLQQSFRNLVDNDPNRNLQSVATALGRFAVAIPEAVRFRLIEQAIADLFRNPGRSLNFNRTHDRVLRNWSRYSSQGLNAPDQPIYNTTFLGLLGVFLFFESE